MAHPPWTRAKPPRATTCSPGTAGSSPSATRASLDRPVPCTSRRRSWAARPPEPARRSSPTGQDHHRLLRHDERQAVDVEELGEVRPHLGEVLLGNVRLVLLHRLEPLLGHAVVLAVVVGPVVAHGTVVLLI